MTGAAATAVMRPRRSSSACRQTSRSLFPPLSKQPHGLGRPADDAFSFQIQMGGLEPPAGLISAGEQVLRQARQQRCLGFGNVNPGGPAGSTATRASRMAVYLARSTRYVLPGEATFSIV